VDVDPNYVALCVSSREVAFINRRSNGGFRRVSKAAAGVTDVRAAVPAASTEMIRAMKLLLDSYRDRRNTLPEVLLLQADRCPF
jgi:hypothetical protein